MHAILIAVVFTLIPIFCGSDTWAEIGARLLWAFALPALIIGALLAGVGISPSLPASFNVAPAITVALVLAVAVVFCHRCNKADRASR